MIVTALDDHLRAGAWAACALRRKKHSHSEKLQLIVYLKQEWNKIIKINSFTRAELSKLNTMF